MRPADVPAEWVEKATEAVAGEMPACGECGEYGPPWCVYCKDDAERYARHALAAVLPLAQAAAQQELITDLLEREMWPMRHENDYPTGAVPKSALLSRRVQIAKRLREGGES